MKAKLNLLWQLFATFFKIGLFTFGGGYAMINVIERETVTKRNWCTSEDIMDMIIIAESTPGVIAVNSATFIGYKQAGVLGGIIATLGVVLPSFLIISILSFVLEAFLSNEIVMAMFKGVRACVVVLIFRAVLTLFKLVDKNFFGYSLMVIAFCLATFTQINVIFIILGGGLLGLLYKYLTHKYERKPVSIDKEDDL